MDEGPLTHRADRLQGGMHASSSRRNKTCIPLCKPVLPGAVSLHVQGEYGPFSESDVIHLAPTDEEREGRRKELIKRRDLARQAKKDAKRMSKKKARGEEPSGGETGTAKNEAKGAHKEDGDGVEAAKGGGDHKTGKRRRRSEKEACRGGDAGPRGSSGATAPQSSGVAGAAAQAVEDAKQSSAVYASLFGKKEVSNEHLFIATAGHRYNLG